MTHRARAWCVLAALTFAVLASSSAAVPSTSGLPRVTLIGDSIAAGIPLEPNALRILRSGIDLNPQLAVCRRLGGQSCPYNGTRPSTLLDLVPTLGRAGLGNTVIVAVGYNDDQESYADEIEASLAALRTAGVTRVLWLTLRAERQSYLTMNDDIRAAAAKHPELTVVDWNLYSRSHPDWFQADGLHIGYGGAVAMATLLHTTLVKLGIAAAPAAPLALGGALPAAHVGQPYRAQVSARGGTGPYRFRAASLPRGLQLRPAGTITGIPTTPGRVTLNLRVTDARGRSAVLHPVLAIVR